MNLLNGWLDSTKILGVHFGENLTWITHVNNLIKSSHATLRSLRRFKRSTSYKVRKTLAKTLILANLRYCITVYSQLPKYLTKHLQRAQNIVAGYVLVRESVRVSQRKWFHYSLGLVPNSRNDRVRYSEMYLLGLKRFEMAKISSNKASRNKTHNTPWKRNDGWTWRRNTFGDQAQDIFNDLPKATRVIKDEKVFIKKSKRYYRDKALARFFSL